MIDKKEFLKFQLEVERRYSSLERKMDELKSELVKQELRHKIEIQQLLLELNKPYNPPSVTDDEKRETNKGAGLLLEYSEDAETLQKLGFKIKENVDG